LFETPTEDKNKELYNKLLGQTKVRDINETYIITANANVMPKCASLSSDLWKTNKAPPYKEGLEIYKVSLNDQSGMSDSDEIKEFLSNFDEDFFMTQFGDHAEITITPEGVSVDEYEHD
jgi:hypothetical protein